MSKNFISKIISWIGIADLFLGIMGSLWLGDFFGYYDYNWPLAITGILLTFVSGMGLFALAEILTLLQMNSDNQEQIIKLLSDRNSSEKMPQKSLLQDIEDNLPVL